MIGSELAFDDSLSPFERWYIRVFGAPILGLRIRARRILPLIEPRYRNILDSGCGQGVLAFEIARRLPQSMVTGADINKTLMERNRSIAARAGLENCRFESAESAENDPQPCHDLILSVDVLEHVENDERVLFWYQASLVRGGDFILHVPAYHRLGVFGGRRVNIPVEGHVRPGYLMEEIVRKIRSAGFTIVRSSYTYGWLETASNTISYLITGARMKNRLVYAAFFPFLLGLSFFGRNSRPARGSGILIVARKE